MTPKFTRISGSSWKTFMTPTLPSNGSAQVVFQKGPMHSHVLPMVEGYASGKQMLGAKEEHHDGAVPLN